MKKIPLTNNSKPALVDDKHYERLNQYKWFYHNTGYAARIGRNLRATLCPIIFMASEVLQTDKKVDHKNRNKLNNQEYNLRICTDSQNLQNSAKHCKTSSEYKGVCFKGIFSDRKRWIAQIRCQGKSIHLGIFSVEKECCTSL